MFASAKRSSVRSTMSSSRAIQAKKNEKVKEMCMGLWGYSRKFLWVSTTGLIVIILPFAFAYFMEMQKQLLKIQGMEGRSNMM